LDVPAHVRRAPMIAANVMHHEVSKPK
jgi:hypothetical protein